MRLLKVLSFLLLSLLLLENAAFGQSSCSSISKSVLIEKVLATASSWSNLRKNAGSLRFESLRLLLLADKKRPQAKAPEGLCPSSCQVTPNPEIVFETVANKFRSDNNDSAKCQKMLEQTSIKPFRYEGRSFSNLDEFTEWFSDFSQGKGEDGKDLYRRCGGNCSPQYVSVISHDDSGYHLQANVRCGPARDKKDNQYQLGVSYLWTCKDKGR